MDIKIAGPDRARSSRQALRPGARRPPAHPRQDGRGAGRAARRSVAATRRASPRSRSSPTRSASIIGPGGKTIKGIIDADRRRHRRRGRRHGAHRVAGRHRGQEGDRHHQGPHRRSPRSARSTRASVKRIADFGAFVEILPGHRRPGPHQRARRTSASTPCRGRLQGRRRDAGEGHRHRSRTGKIRLSRKEAIGKTPDVVHNFRAAAAS